MPPVEFEPTISAGKRPQTYALDREATGTGSNKLLEDQNTNYRAHFVIVFIRLLILFP